MDTIDTGSASDRVTTLGQTKNMLSGNIRARSIGLLADALVHLVDLGRQAKSAHWNVKGPAFIVLHELFDRVVTEADGFTDTVAERLVALGGTADARSQTVAEGTRLPRYPLDRLDWADHVDAVSGVLATVGELMREGIDRSAGWGDAVTADVLTEVSRGTDKLLWLVEAHRATTDTR